MDQFNNNPNNNQQNPYQLGNQNELSSVKTTGNKPKTIHVAHRRSPSELTTLMCMYHSI